MIAPAPQQKFLTLGDPRKLSLLMLWSAVRGDFPNTGEQELRSWIRYELRWCFNLGLGGDREFICVLRSCVDEQKLRMAGGSVRPKVRTLDEAIAAALPEGPSFFASVLARQWNISPDQMHLLVPHIGCVPKLYQPKDSPTILRANAEKFLRGRVI